jgi:hypothetical protein
VTARTTSWEGINTESWSKVKAKATLERQTMREVIFEGLQQYIIVVQNPSSPNKKRKGEKKAE